MKMFAQVKSVCVAFGIMMMATMPHAALATQPTEREAKCLIEIRDTPFGDICIIPLP